MRDDNCDYERLLNLVKTLNIVLNIVEKPVMYLQSDHSYNKRKDSLKGSLVLVLFATEIEFPEILVPRLPQNSSNVKIKCGGKSRQLYSLCDQLLGALIYLYFIILTLICF